MTKKLLKTALITSPILALYGMAPIFLIDSVDFQRGLIAFGPLPFVIFSFWAFNIYLVRKNLKTGFAYLLSFLVTFVLHSCILFLIPNFPDGQRAKGLLVYSLISTLAVNSIILVIIDSELLKRKRDLAESEVQKLKVVNLEAQKQVLLQQLHPHFLFNALSTLKSLIRKTPVVAEEYSVKLSEFLRYSIQSKGNDTVTIKEELQFNEDYLALQKVRFGDAFNYAIEIPKDIRNKKLPVFALQTLVENAFKHNSFTEEKPLSISIKYVDGKIAVSNNKIPKALIRKTGTGLKNLNERYELESVDPVEIIEDEAQFKVILNLLAP